MLMSRAEALRCRNQTVECLRFWQRAVVDPSKSWKLRYEAAVMIDACKETISDFDLILSLIPEA